MSNIAKNIDQDRLDDLLDAWEERREEGREASIEELCKSCPELVRPLREQIRLLSATDWLDAAETEEGSDAWKESQILALSEQDVDTKLPKSALTVDEFSHQVMQSGVLDESELMRLQQHKQDSVPRDATSFATDLVKAGKMTPYQAKVVLEERNDPLLLDRYLILDTLDSGGMGLVFKALHKSMERVVALKILPASAVDSPDKVERFRRETKAAAMLSHPNIAAAYDADHSDGTHFLVMEYVRGADLYKHVKRSGILTVGQAVNYVLQAACGLQHAHEQGIIHRDIKPANLVLSEDGTVKIIDMGLARIQIPKVNGAAVYHDDLTGEGTVMGTIAYMSPEQALETKQADARSDIYSLGATLHYLLTANAPYSETTSLKTLVAHREHPIPSLGEARDDVPDELNNVFQRMVAKSPTDRYASMNEVIAALESCGIDTTAVERGNAGLDNSVAEHEQQQISTLIAGGGSADTAPQPTLDYVDSRKPPRRGLRWLAAAGGGALVLLLAGIIIVIKTPDGKTTRIHVPAGSDISLDEVGRSVPLVPLKVPEAGSIALLANIWTPGPADKVLPGLIANPAKKPGIRRWQVQKRDWGVYANSLAWHPNGRLVASAYGHGAIRLINSESLELERCLPGHAGGKVSCVAWNGDGSVLASSGSDGTVRLWNAEGMQGPVLDLHTDQVNAVAWSHSGQWLASASSDGTARLWKVDGTPGPILDGHSGSVLCVEWSPDGQLIATGGRDRSIRLWYADGTPGRVIKDKRGSIHQLRWTNNNQIAASAGSTIRVWNTDGTQGPSFEGHVGLIYDMALSPNGQQMATAGIDKKLRLWTYDGSLQEVINQPSWVRAVAWSPDSRRVISFCADGSLRLHSSTGKLLYKRIDGNNLKWPHSVSVSPDGSHVVSGHSNGLVRLVDADGTLQAALTDHTDRIHSIAWSADGTQFATASTDTTVRIWGKDGTAGPVLEGHTGAVLKVAWSPDGKSLVTGSNDKSVRLWKADGTAGPIFNGHTGFIYAVAWNPDGKQIASASADGTARVWNVDGTEGPTIAKLGRYKVLAIDWSPDGKRIATGSTLGFVNVYAADGSNVDSMRLNSKSYGYCYDVEWNHDGSLLASAHGDARVRLWNPDGSSAGILQDHGEVVSLNWSADGHRLATATASRTVSLWNTDSKHPVWTAVGLAGVEFATVDAKGDWIEADAEHLEEHIVHVVEHDDGRLETLKPSEFRDRVAN